MRDRFSQLSVDQHSGSDDTSTSTSQQSSDTAVTTNEPHLLLYIQMQLCRRESLKDWLCANTLDRDPKQMLCVFDQILLAVDYVHECGMIHRDLKPSNIFFSLDGTVKVGDFGLVTATEEHVTEDDSEIWGDRVTTQTPQRHTNQVGTKLYMSPEQIAGNDYTHKVDIYALGMIFFELFYPFTTEMERLDTLLAVKQLQFPETFSRDLPSKCTFLKPLLSHNPSERPDTKDIRSDALLANFEEVRVAAERLRIVPTPKPQSDSPSSGSLVNKDNS
ncbi:hypothetical protein NP493_200g02009 [Ridgeia piscesae]|uniref:non-specific serine/threonine protein kinase n=1 Tax=Ridgeia piscesae TaxID=27915 RepID=A0AAD9UEK1_RIDPI|nr:hypothetical protein NP493_200g02009 [Ridgeia piscesae]